MKLSELIAHVAQSVLDDRTAMVNGSPDSLWSNEVLTRYFRRAEEIFATRTHCIVDDETAACCQITLVAEQARYELHTSVLRVLSVTPNDSDIDLARWTYDTMRPRFDSTPGYFDVNLTYTDAPGRPLWFNTDKATKVLQVRPAPRTEDVTDIVTLNLRVARRPINALGADLNAEPEIPEEYHLDLCDYVAYRALSQPTVDDDAKSEASNYLREFERSIRRAKADRLVAGAGPVQWQFGGWARD